jgi:hypothetical protein
MKNIGLRFFTLLMVLSFENARAAVSESHVSQAVGQVGSLVLTSREVQISYALEQASFIKPGAKNIDRKSWALPMGSELYKAHLNQLMIELLVKLEAETFSVAQISLAEVHREVAEAKSHLHDWSEWKKWEVAEVEVEQIMIRRKMAKQFLKFKTESSGVVISEEEVKAYFDKNKAKFGSANYAQFKDTIREVLAQKQLEEKLKDWFEVLKRKYRVRFLNSPTAPQATSRAS